MTQTHLTRVGIVAKRGLLAAADHLERLGDWLQRRSITPVFEEDTARLAGRSDARVLSRDDLPAEVDLVVVMGGDGTLLSMATRTAHSGRDVQIVGVLFGIM
jgi:NAD+ kinase